MKKLLTLVILAIVVGITSCQQQPGPQPAQPTSPAVTTPTPPDLTTDAGIAQTLVGTWLEDSCCEYAGGNYQFRNNTYMYQVQYLSTPYNSAPNSTSKGCYYGVYGYTTMNFTSWEMSATMFNTYGKHFIQGGKTSGFIYTITPTTMIIGVSSGNVMQGSYFFYHKTS
jgi:hypothetical protein